MEKKKEKTALHSFTPKLCDACMMQGLLGFLSVTNCG